VVLDNLDPEQAANEERIIANLRSGGNWTDDDEAVHQLERAEAAAR
jgi:hypothetical protein